MGKSSATRKSSKSVATETTDTKPLIDPRYVVRILCGILLLAFLIRAVDLPRESLWYDEVATIEHLGEPTFGTFLDAVRKWNPKVPPLYLSMEYFWAKLIGSGQISLRILSLIPGMGSIYLGYLLLAKLHSKEAGLLTAYLMAVSATHVYYSLEIRMYSLLLMLLLFSIYSYFRLLETKSRPWWFIHIGTTVAIVWTHQLGLMILPCLALHAYFFGFSDHRSKIVWTAWHTAAVSTFIPWFFTVDTDNLGQEYTYFTAPVLFAKFFDPNAPSVQHLISMWITPPNHWNNYLSTYEWKGSISTAVLFFGNVLMVALYAVGAGLSIWNLVQYFKKRTDRIAGEHLIFLLSLFLIPIVTLFIVSYVWEPSFMSRYMLISLIAMMACLAISLVTIPVKKLRTFMISALLVGTLCQVAVDSQAPHRGSWSEVVQLLETEQSLTPRLHVIGPTETELKYAQQYVVWNIQDSRMKSIPYFSFSDLEMYLLGGYVQASRTVGNQYYGDAVLVLSPEKLLQLTDYLDKYKISYTVVHIPARDYLDYVRLNPPPY
ncbi:MAG: glycosyltransferase family 39 protein [Candidatus Hydrogenedentota bacterium]